MLSLSRKTDYALLILTALAEERDTFRSLKTLATARHLPYAFTAQVVRPLLQRGILESREGMHGGYRLAKDPARITIRDVVAAEEGGVALVACLDPEKEFMCAQKAVCTARKGMPVVQRLILQTLSRHTIADLLSTGLPLSASRGKGHT